MYPPPSSLSLPLLPLPPSLPFPLSLLSPSLLLTTQHVHEIVNGLKFRISPEAFFQVNTPATEVLYSTIADLVSGSSGSPPPPTLYGWCVCVCLDCV